MIAGILSHTPTWVWIVFSLVLALGFSQTRSREVGAVRVTLLPVAMMVLSLSGVVMAFGQVPIALAAWAAGFGLSLTLVGPWFAVRGASWSPRTRRFHIPGSWLPLILILGVFVTKYAAGVCIAVDHSLAANVTFATLLSLAYGSFSALFWVRARSLRAVMVGSSPELAA